MGRETEDVTRAPPGFSRFYSRTCEDQMDADSARLLRARLNLIEMRPWLTVHTRQRDRMYLSGRREGLQEGLEDVDARLLFIGKVQQVG